MQERVKQWTFQRFESKTLKVFMIHKNMKVQYVYGLKYVDQKNAKIID